MTLRGVALALAVLLAPGGAAAQEVPGAERIEIGTALFGGGMLFMPSSSRSEPSSGSYVLSGALTTNLNRWVGLEGDIGLAMGRGQAHDRYGVLPANSNDQLPNVLLYSGHVIYNPWTSERHVVPYVSVGAGAMTAFARAASSDFGLGGDRTYPTISVGGGVRWFPIRHWGVRGDYRFMGIRRGDSPSPSPGSRVVRSAHRVYGALVLTFQ
jgi:hypothetical protein